MKKDFKLRMNNWESWGKGNLHWKKLIFCTDVIEGQTTDERAQMRDSSDVITLKYCLTEVIFVLSFSKKQMSRSGHTIKNTVIA